MLNFPWVSVTWHYVSSYQPFSSNFYISVQPTLYHIGVSYTIFYKFSNPVNFSFVCCLTNLCLPLHLFLYIVQTFISYYLIAVTSLLLIFRIRLNFLSCSYYLCISCSTWHSPYPAHSRHSMNVEWMVLCFWKVELMGRVII